MEERVGLVVMEVSGAGAKASFRHEPGGHRFQRVPENEKRGRVHTSTVTVAVLDPPDESSFAFPDRDLRWQATRGSGAGGQARNKTSSAIQLTHVPTGTTVRVETERSQSQNLRTAKILLWGRLRDAREESAKGDRDADRRRQVGSGQRGDKVRSIAIQRDQVVHHPTGARWTADRYLRGDLSPIYG